MGKNTFSREAHIRATRIHVPKSGPATAKAEQKARETGQLHPLVDPKGYGVIRRSLPRFEQQENGLWKLTIGTPMPIETRLDTTASMGSNVDIALKVLPDMHEYFSSVLPGHDLQIATGIFGDVVDKFVICRPQFEMVAEKIVEQLTLMVPERDGGDFPEDPHYGLFGATYLTDAYINKIGLKGYDFTVSDAPARHRLDERQLIRIYGEEVFAKVVENGHQINTHNLPTTEEVAVELLKRAHAFFLQVDSYRGEDTYNFWSEIFGSERVIVLPDTRLIPQVQASIIGLTEGTLDLQNISDFLRKNNVSERDARRITRSLAGIPIGEQMNLPNFKRRPQAGDLFANKTDLWPINQNELETIYIQPISNEQEESNPDEEDIDWL